MATSTATVGIYRVSTKLDGVNFVFPPHEPPDLVLEERFAIVPEWLLDAEIGDAAVRPYAVLLRYGQSSGARMPSGRRWLDVCGKGRPTRWTGR